ncbi:hypothetical protein KKC1_27670 [Calderihabitans maritimus]|uniref:Uncharacterized protein n=1 Tax=Calderihabitans maritimus TaxID=1246530 RepID=A0A1Z5HVR5_9FIRM|nr:hypothetical protein KKC1_27670 [Calderihabitans maritimus]
MAKLSRSGYVRYAYREGQAIYVLSKKGGTAGRKILSSLIELVG